MSTPMTEQAAALTIEATWRVLRGLGESTRLRGHLEELGLAHPHGARRRRRVIPRAAPRRRSLPLTSGSTRSLSGCARRAASPWSALRGIPAYAGRVVATAVNADCKREVLGSDVGTSEDGGLAGRPCAVWWHEGSPAWSW